MSKIIDNGDSQIITVEAGHYVKIAWLGGTYTLTAIAGGLPNLPAVQGTANSAADQTFGPYASAVTMRLQVSAIGAAAWDSGASPVFEPPGDTFVRQSDGIPVALSGTGTGAAFIPLVDGGGNSSVAVATTPPKERYIWAYNEDGSVVKRKTVSAARVVRDSTMWFQPTAVTGSNVTVSDYAGAAFVVQNNADASKPKLLTFTAGGYSTLSWTGLALAQPTDNLLQALIYIPDMNAAATSGNLEITLTDSGGGAITYRYYPSFFRSGWNTLPLWNPATDANFAFASKTSWIQVTANTINWGLNVASVGMKFNSAAVATTAILPGIFTWQKTKPMVCVTFDTSATDIFTNFTPEWAAKGLSAGIRAGGDDYYRGGTFTPLYASAYAAGFDIYNGSWKRVGLTSATTADVLARELGLQENWGMSRGYSRGSELFSSIGNGVASEATTKSICEKFGVELVKWGNSKSTINYFGPAGLDYENYIAVRGWAGRTDVMNTVKAAVYLGGFCMWFAHECPIAGAEPPPDSSSPGNGGGMYREDAVYFANYFKAQQDAGVLEVVSPSKLAAVLRCQA